MNPQTNIFEIVNFPTGQHNPPRNRKSSPRLRAIRTTSVQTAPHSVPLRFASSLHARASALSVACATTTRGWVVALALTTHVGDDVALKHRRPTTTDAQPPWFVQIVFCAVSIPLAYIKSNGMAERNPNTRNFRLGTARTSCALCLY